MRLHIKKYHEDNKKIFKKVETEKFQRKILCTRRNEIKLKSSNGHIILTKKLNWVILPKGKNFLKELQYYYEEIASKRSTFGLDFSRIEKIITLNPDSIYEGINEFEGYCVFYFNKAQLAVLECPEVGNAIYIIKENWRNLSKFTKGTLLNYYSHKVDRIIHSGSWFQKLKYYLKKHTPKSCR